MVSPEEPGDWVTVLTTVPTLPLPSNAERPVVETEHLVLRAVTEADLAALHALRSRPQVMRFTLRGVVDKDVAATRERLCDFLPPRDVGSFSYANTGSQKVILKCGFEEVLCRTKPVWSKPESTVLNHFYQYRPGRAVSGR